MALLKFNNIGIKAISTTVPHKIVKTNSLTDYYSKEELDLFIAATCVEERRFTYEYMCASNLCEKSPLTAGTSIPLCMVENRDKIKENNSVLMNAIGVGFAHGTVLINIGDCKILERGDL